MYKKIECVRNNQEYDPFLKGKHGSLPNGVLFPYIKWFVWLTYNISAAEVIFKY